MLNLDICQKCFIESRPSSLTPEGAVEKFSEYLRENKCVCIYVCQLREHDLRGSNVSSSSFPVNSVTLGNVQAGKIKATGNVLPATQKPRRQVTTYFFKSYSPYQSSSSPVGMRIRCIECSARINPPFVTVPEVPSHCKYFMEQVMIQTVKDNKYGDAAENVETPEKKE